MKYIIKDECEGTYYDGSGTLQDEPNMFINCTDLVYDAYIFDTKEEAVSFAKILAKTSHYITIIELY